MKLLETVAVAFSMFSALPVKSVAWDDHNMRYSLCAFPLVGVVIALCCRAWVFAGTVLDFPAILRGAGLCLLPPVLTGGIHLDGYADTCDALASHAGSERRQEILKDPHLGAFAAIRLCMYFLCSFALWTTLPIVKLPALIGLFGLSRSLSGLSLTCFPLREGSGLAGQFARAADRKRVRTVLLVLAFLFAALLVLGDAWGAPLAACAVFLYYRRMCVKNFTGLSGDLAGWFLQTAELWMLAAWVLTEYGRKLL